MFENLGLNPQQQAIAEKIASYGFAAGMTEAGVSAMVTAAIHESSLNPTLSHPDAPPGSAQQFNSNGLFQMNRDRWDNLVEYAAQNGLDPWSADAQIGYQIHEMTNPPKPGISNYQKIAEPLFTSNDPAAASRAMSRIEGHAVLRDAQGLTEADRRAQTASGVYKDDYGNLVSAKYEIQGPPASAEAAKAPGIGLQSASMGGLIGPITSAQTDPIPGNPDDPISQSSFFGQIGNAALKQTGQPFGAINMGTPAGFNRPGISYGYVGNPVTPSLFNDELSPQISAYAPVDVPPTAPAAPAPQPGAQLPGLGGMPPAGTFGAIPLGNYSMASVPAPAPQPSANVSTSALAGPVPSLSLSGQASYPAPSPSAAVAPRDDMTTPPPGYSPVDVPTPPSLPSPEEARASLAGLNFTQGSAAPTPAAFGTNYAPNDTATQAAKPAERFWSERLPGEGELNPVTSVEYAPKAGPVSIDGAPLAELNPAVGGFGAMPAAPPSVSMVTPNITTAAPPSSYGPVTPVAPNEEAMQLPAASQELPAPAAPLTLNELPAPAAPAFGSVAAPSSPAIAPPDDYALPTQQSAPSTPALGLPGATTAVDIQQGLASLPAPVDLPSTPPAPAAPHPGTQWAGLANMDTPPAFGGIPTVGADLLSPSLTKVEEAIPTVKAPDAPTTPQVTPSSAPVGVPMAAPAVAPAAPAVRSMAAPTYSAPAPAAAPSYQAPSTPQAPPSFGAISAPQAQAAPSAYGTMPVGDWSWNATQMTPQSFGAYGSFANISDWTPASYEFAPTEVQIAATGSGPFGALSDAFGGSSFGYDYNNGLF